MYSFDVIRKQITIDSREKDIVPEILIVLPQEEHELKPFETSEIEAGQIQSIDAFVAVYKLDWKINQYVFVYTFRGVRKL